MDLFVVPLLSDGSSGFFPNHPLRAPSSDEIDSKKPFEQHKSLKLHAFQSARTEVDVKGAEMKIEYVSNTCGDGREQKPILYLLF